VLRLVAFSGASLLAAFTLAACGTTVPNDQVAGGGDAGLGVDGGTTGAVSPIGGPTGPAGNAPPAGGTTGLGGSAKGTAAKGAGSIGSITTREGVNRPLRVGVASTDIGAIAAAFGRDPKAANNPLNAAKKIIAFINSSGGVAGRKIEAVFAQGDSATDANANGQRVCSALTEDTKVDIVVNLGMLGELFPSCLQQRGVAVVDGIATFTDAHDMQRHPNWLVPLAMRLDRFAPALLRNAAQRGVVKRGDTLGVLREDCPWGQRIYGSNVRPVAEELGLKVVEGTVKCVENLVADLGPVTTDIQRETLRFNGSGVTHVMALSGAEAFLVAQFTQNASKQGFYPKYLVTSQAYPYGNSQDDAIVSISPDALPSMSGIGAVPLFDVGDAVKPANATQLAAQNRCKQADPTLMGSQSETSSGRYFQRNVFYGMCDTFFVMKALLEASGLRTSIPDVARGYRTALGAGLGSAVLVAGHFGVDAERLDGVDAARPVAYDSTAQRFTYVGRAFELR